MNKHTTFKSRAALFMVLAVFSAFASSAQTWQWGKRGGSIFNGNNSLPKESVTDIAVDKNGNVYMTGIIESSGPPNVDGHTLTTYGDKDIIIASFSCTGIYRWSKVIGGVNSDRPTAIGVDTLGHVYVGVQILPSSSLGQEVHYSNDSTQPLSCKKTVSLIQYDTLGNFKWLRQPSPDTVGINTSINLSASYDIYVEGNGDVYSMVLQPAGLASGTTWATSQPQTYILKYNVQGTMIDHIPLQMQTTQVVFSSIRFSRSKTGRFIVAGTPDYGQNIGTFALGGISTTKGMFLASFSPQGSLIWERQNTLSTQATRMWARPQLDNQDNIYYAGDCSKGDVFNGYTFTNSISNIPGSVPFIGKADSNGKHLWITNAGGKAANAQNSLGLKNQNEIWLSGSSPSVYWDATHFIQSPPNSGYPVYVARFNSSGSILSLDSLKGAFGGQNFATCNAVDKNGNLIVAGDFNLTLNVNSSTTLTNSGGLSDFFIAKFGYPCNCTTQPTSNFTATITTGNNVRFNYSGTTSNIDSLVWTWGDGQRQTVKTGLTTAITHTYTAVGSYNACANVYGTCGTSSFCKTTTVSVGVSNLSALGAIKVYPNPANTYFTIEGAEGATALLTNRIGQKAMQFSVNAERQLMDISNLPAGMYLLQITDAKGNRGVMSLVKE